MSVFPVSVNYEDNYSDYVITTGHEFLLHKDACLCYLCNLCYTNFFLQCCLLYVMCGKFHFQLRKFMWTWSNFPGVSTSGGVSGS